MKFVYVEGTLANVFDMMSSLLSWNANHCLHTWGEIGRETHGERNLVKNANRASAHALMYMLTLSPKLVL